jgi:hypothetical protein
MLEIGFCARFMVFFAILFSWVGTGGGWFMLLCFMFCDYLYVAVVFGGLVSWLVGCGVGERRGRRGDGTGRVKGGWVEYEVEERDGEYIYLSIYI